MTTLFLDFDGVLHPEFCHPTKHFCCLPYFEAAVRQAPECVIVISSTWRLIRTFDELIQPFSPDVAQRIVGVTPLALDLNRKDLPDSCLSYDREAECQAWLRANGRAHLPWIALDDRIWLYRPFNPNLYVVDGDKGLVQGDVERLVQRLHGLR